MRTMRASALRLLFSLLFFQLLPCKAQELAPSFELSADETAKARQLAKDVESAQDRASKANAARRTFGEIYQAAHADLPNLRFTSDFRVAFARSEFFKIGYPDKVDSVELTPEEQQKLKSLHLVADHVEKPSSVSPVYLPSGK